MTSNHATEVNHEIGHEAVRPVAGDIRALITPSHTAEHLAFFWPFHEGEVLVGDAASNFFGLGYSLIYENLQQGQRSLASLAKLDFEVTCFGHGRPIRQDASKYFRQKWIESQMDQVDML